MKKMADEVDGEDDAAMSPKSALEAKQKQEMKELRLKVQSLRKTVTKGDKKRRREVNDEIARMEKEMVERHTREQNELDKSASCKSASEAEELVMSSPVELPVQEPLQEPKLSKAQKRREKREREEKERQERIQKAEAEAVPSLREVEQETLSSQLVSQGMEVKDIPPDGHCLYAAISDQLRVRCGLDVRVPLYAGGNVPVAKLRSRCADYMRSHSSEYSLFAMDHDTGKPCTEETFEKYCDEVAHSAVWGGQLEIQVLAQVFTVAVTVHQAGQAAICIGREHQREGELHLAYHHHAYGLGEHYNSVIPKK